MKTGKIYALGFFDGVHLGHQALLTACKHLAQEKDCLPGVVTFGSHPDALVQNSAPPLINTVEERQRLFLGHRISHILVLPFDEALMRLSWQSFLEQLMAQGAAGFVCGEDFRFGHKGQGNAQLLADFCRQRNMPYAIVSAQLLDGIRISSTYIRQLIAAGQMEEAAKFLGHPHILSGVVVSGRKLGRTIGIPTANLQVPAGVILPPRGVYACKVIAEGKEYAAVTNVGSRPTVGGHHVTVEPWILDFEGDLYGKQISVAFYKFLRPEKKFDSLEQLQVEIQKNAEETRKFFA